jgi:hypothetical protein
MMDAEFGQLPIFGILTIVFWMCAPLNANAV